MRIFPWDAIKRVPIYIDARVLHVTVLMHTGSRKMDKTARNGGREGRDACTPPQGTPPLVFRSLLLDFFGKIPAKVATSSSLTFPQKGTRCWDRLTRPISSVRQCCLKIPFSLPKFPFSLCLPLSFSLTGSSPYFRVYLSPFPFSFFFSRSQWIRNGRFLSSPKIC